MYIYYNLETNIYEYNKKKHLDKIPEGLGMIEIEREDWITFLSQISGNIGGTPIIRVIDDKLVLEIVPQDLDECKEQRILQLNRNCTDFIYLTYDLFAQINIGNGLKDYTESDLTEMKDYINPILLDCDNRKVLINACKTNEEVDSTNISFN